MVALIGPVTTATTHIRPAWWSIGATVVMVTVVPPRDASRARERGDQGQEPEERPHACSKARLKGFGSRSITSGSMRAACSGRR